MFLSAACGWALLVLGCGKKDTAGPATDASKTTATAPAGGTAAGAPTAASGRLIEITGNDTMKFSITEIRAKPGESLTVQLSNIGTMPKFSMGHNWVLLKPTANIEAFVGEAAQAATTEYVPPSKKADVLAHTKLLGPKEKDSVTFQAPKQPGKYPFLCSFPGHYQVGMKGDLIVE
jgi:azurin